MTLCRQDEAIASSGVQPRLPAGTAYGLLAIPDPTTLKEIAAASTKAGVYSPPRFAPGTGHATFRHIPAKARCYLLFQTLSMAMFLWRSR
ncbi:unnamed protein product [Ectocarpus sp. 4 AP-2014]